MLDSGKTSPFPSNTQLTLIIAWGEFHIKISPAMDDTKPKNIKELTQIIKDRIVF
jgi:hypothetical protein